MGEKKLKVRIEKLIKHLKTQIAVSDGMDSEFVYITKDEAKKCLELAEAQDTLFAKPVHVDVEGGGSNWWNVCEECRSSLHPGDKYCHECGRKLEWG